MLKRKHVNSKVLATFINSKPIICQEYHLLNAHKEHVYRLLYDHNNFLKYYRIKFINFNKNIVIHPDNCYWLIDNTIHLMLC